MDAKKKKQSVTELRWESLLGKEKTRQAPHSYNQLKKKDSRSNLMQKKTLKGKKSRVHVYTYVYISSV